MSLRSASIAIVLLVSVASGQQAQTTPGVSATADLHRDAVKLIDEIGVRQILLGQKSAMVQAGSDQIRKSSPNIDPAFVEEWSKRMAARLNVDDFVAVYVRVYEAHFTDGELRELIQAQIDSKQSKTPTLSPELRQKLTTDGIAIQSEMMGGCSQIGAKLGGEIGQELDKEHPEWSKPSQPATDHPGPK